MAAPTPNMTLTIVFITGLLLLATSAVISAVLLSPLRDKIERFIDSRVCDSQGNTILASFTSRALLATDFEALTGELIEVVKATMGPEEISIWLKGVPSRSQPARAMIDLRSEPLVSRERTELQRSQPLPDTENGQRPATPIRLRGSDLGWLS